MIILFPFLLLYFIEYVWKVLMPVGWDDASSPYWWSEAAKTTFCLLIFASFTYTLISIIKHAEGDK